MKPHHLLILIVAFYGCSSNSKLSSTFGERKYTKGHFWDVPASAPTVTTNSNAIITKTVPVRITSHEVTLEHKTIQPLLNPKKLITAKHSITRLTQQIETVHNTTEHISTIQSASPTDEVTDEDRRPKKTEGIVLFFVGIVLLLCAYLLSVYISALAIGGAGIVAILLVIPMVLLLIAGLILFIVGLVDWIKYSKH